MTENFERFPNRSKSPATKKRNDKNNNKKQINKDLCPFACPNCQSLGQDLVKSRFEIINILSDNGDSIFSPMHEEERYHDDECHKNHNSSALRNGKVFLSVDLLDSFFQQKFKK